MSALDLIGLQVVPISCSVGDGYALHYQDNVQTSVCVIVNDEAGELTYASYNGPQTIEPSRIEHLLNAPTDSREHAPWAFAMAGGDRVDSLMDRLNLPHVARDQIRGELLELLKTEKARLHRLDQRGLAAIERSYKQTKSAYAFYAGDGDRAEVRRQAAASYPILADILSSNLTAKMAVDRKKPVAEIVANLLSKSVDAPITKPILKRLSAANALPDGVNLTSVVRLMAVVPPDWIPTSGQEWHSFCSVAGGLFEDLAAPDDAVAPLIKSAQGKWSDFCRRVVKKAGYSDDELGSLTLDELDETFRTKMQTAAEMLDDFKNFVVLPLAAHGGDSDEVMVTAEMAIAARQTAFEMLFRNKTLLDLADQQRRYFLGRNGILSAASAGEEEKRAELLSSVEVGTWPGLTDPVQAPNGLWLVPIRSAPELQAEGAALDHCVGSYANVAQKCESFIVSVRSLDENGEIGRRHSTIEFGLNSSNDRLNVKQHRARKNAAADGRAKDAANWYVSAVAAGQVKINRKLINAFLEEVPIPDDGIERICNYEWKQREVLNLAVMPWFPFVNKKYQAMNLDGLMDTPEVASISEMIAPDPLSYRLG